MKIRPKTYIPTLTGVLGAVLFGIAWGMRQWIESNRSTLPPPRSEQGLALSLTYNMASHGIFLLVLSCLLIWLLREASRHKKAIQDISGKGQTHWLQNIGRAAIRHPFATLIFTSISIFMVSEASWFYKEIIGWFDNIQEGYLLDNFSLRMNLFSETMSRNDYRFYPLAFQDLHILSWITPYPKIWMLFNVAEMIATVIIGAKIISLVTKNRRPGETTTMFAILFIFIAPSAYSYFQFIYSERIVVLLFAGYLYAYLRYQSDQSIVARNTALACALLGIFFKDTAILLFITPAVLTLLLGNTGMIKGLPKPWQTSRHQWIKAYQFELAVMSLSILFILSFIYLSYLPSFFVGEERYDAELKFARFEPDIRLLFLGLYSAYRLFTITAKKSSFNLIDGANAGAIAYTFALFYFVGYRSSNYMALPMHFVAVIDILIVWQNAIRPKFAKKFGYKSAGIAGTFLCAAVIYGEHQVPHHFYGRIKDMTLTQRSWQATFKKSDEILRQARESGEPVNVIFSKSWFRRFSHLKTLKYDRLVYLNEDTKQYLIVDGVGKGNSYTPQQGDYFLDIDTGNKRIKEFNINMDGFEPIYEYSPTLKNGRIYRMQ